MANEINLYQDLEYCENKILEHKNNPKKLKFWKREHNKIADRIKEEYPDLSLEDERNYLINFSFIGTGSVSINAKNEEEAKKIFLDKKFLEEDFMEDEEKSFKITSVDERD